MKAVFFDANGVLYCRSEKSRYLEAFLAKHGLSMPAAQALKEATGEIRDRALRGQVSNDEYHEAVLVACGVTDPVLMAQGCLALDQDHSNITLFEQVRGTLQALRARGFKLGIVTDAAVSKATKLRWLKAQGLDLSWDAYANSMDLGVRKPDVRMYQEAVKQAGVAAVKSVFVGHDRRELAGARAAALTTVAFNCDAAAEADYYIARFSDLLDLPFLQRAA